MFRVVTSAHFNVLCRLWFHEPLGSRGSIGLPTALLLEGPDDRRFGLMGSNTNRLPTTRRLRPRLGATGPFVHSFAFPNHYNLENFEEHVRRQKNWKLSKC
ncbi:unnamed protein product [Ectocarpus fasciculatus]